MILKNRVKSWSVLFEVYSLSLILAWSIIIAILLVFGIFQIRQVQRELVQKEAHANFSKDQAFRLWATTHGGVYVPVTTETPPNPYLSHIQERDLKTPSGIDLTLMNPAYMLRQTMDKYENHYGIRGHITSLIHFRPETAPDEWEKDALKKFEKGVKEVFDYAKIDGRPYFRFMAPMITEKGCLKCHGHQGYNVGDIRGGVSVSVPMAPYLANQRRQTISYSISFSLLWLFGFIGILLTSRGLKHRVGERDRAEAELKKAHDKLEQRVEKRTSELTKANIQLKREMEERKQVEEKQRKSEKTHVLQIGFLPAILRVAASIIIAVGVGHKLGKYSVTGNVPRAAVSQNRPEYLSALSLEWSSELAWFILEDDSLNMGDQQ